ncbi:AAA family ATPase [Plantactinospora sp. WMMB334]|uniref:AAA family ATPase n=1 Tax=Plantactinospora sp. WMMB334 TaxID=3404119 RepID=UPI003B928DA0
MPLRKLVLENYRCFRDRQEIELAPVTVVLGKNNSGKSVLTRAPLVIATGFDTTSELPLDLDRLGPDAVDDWADLHFGQNVYRPFTIGLSVDGRRTFDLSATIQYVDLIRRPVLQRWSIRSATFNATLTWDVPSAAVVSSEGPRAYARERPSGLRTVGPVSFQGLRPGLDEFPAAEMRRWGLSPGLIRYLGPYRERWGRQHRMPLGGPGDVGDNGAGVPGILAYDQVRHGGALLDSVNRRLRDIVPGWRLDEVADGSRWKTVLTREDGGKLQVNLADAGSGLAQVLPILVQCALDERDGSASDPPLQIIEEPEMHLHPAAHAELADLYLRTAKATGTRFLVETHSETLLLRLRRRIAQQDYPPEMVAVHVVEQVDGVSTVRRVGIDGLGNLDDDWPEGYFSQDYHEVRGLAKAQARRRRDAS